MNRIYGASKSGESAGKTMIKLDAARAKNVRCRVETRHRGLSQII